MSSTGEHPADQTPDFWHRLQKGVEVAVASGTSDKLLGVRDGFRRYFLEGLDWSVPIVVVAHGELGCTSALPLSDPETIATARREVERLRRTLGATYHFYVGAEGGLHSLEVEGQLRCFVHSWAVVHCAAGQAWGSSGSLQLPERLVDGVDRRGTLLSTPGTRRGGGMIESMTGGLESRRRAVGLATLHALSTLFYGTLGSRPAQPP